MNRIKKVLRYFKKDQKELIDEKTDDQKSHETVPLSEQYWMYILGFFLLLSCYIVPLQAKVACDFWALFLSLIDK